MEEESRRGPEKGTGNNNTYLALLALLATLAGTKDLAHGQERGENARGGDLVRLLDAIEGRQTHPAREENEAAQKEITQRLQALQEMLREQPRSEQEKVAQSARILAFLQEQASAVPGGLTPVDFAAYTPTQRRQI